MLGYAPNAFDLKFVSATKCCVAIEWRIEMIKGDRFCRLVYLGESQKIKKHTYGMFRCDCGREKRIRIDGVSGGQIKSCGCLYHERCNEFGLNSIEYERLYNVWANMRKRCYDTKSDRYYAYGAKGITVCDEWKDDFHAFAKFAIDNGWNSKLSIERIDLAKGYEPQNCIFITMKQQARNKTSNIKVNYNGEIKCIAEWCEVLGLNDKRTYRRYQLGIRNPDILFYPGDLRGLRRRA
ncbi:Uncharacterised protein [Dorea longicatena]|uniref:Uncharacterized protein n=2 Tax=Dorea longicatena TaxID=88431 RepID=A0A173S892_9FIRM|nr:Uncharacterised protein [Dorea longicatena]